MTETTFNFEQASYTDLFNYAKDIQNQLVETNHRSKMMEVGIANLSRKQLEAGKIVERLIQDKIIEDEEDITTLVTALDITLFRTMNFTISLEITGQIDIPFGEEVSEYNFEIDGVSYNGQSSNNFDTGHVDLDFDFDE